MFETNIYQDIATRTNGALMIGVVGPVRTGKSTFIKRFMETLVIPNIDNTFMRERTKDELPQSGSGKTIMTAEPKFVPENSVEISIADNSQISVRLVDCVGYMVEGANGLTEDGSERMVTTPWFEHEISISKAAEEGTRKVIGEHSTVGVLVTTDGSICDIEREKYTAAEERCVSELKALGKPFVVLLNCAEPDSDESIRLSAHLEEKYSARCIAVNCLKLDEKKIIEIMTSLLHEFPLKSMAFYLPEWLEALPTDNELYANVIDEIRERGKNLCRMKHCRSCCENLACCDDISAAVERKYDLGFGSVSVDLELPRSKYYSLISEMTGMDIADDADLFDKLSRISTIKRDYDMLSSALEDVRTKGYGVVMPSSSQMQLDEPQIVRQGGKYSVKLKASAPAIHMMMTNIETEVTPAIGGENASEDIINFLLQGFDGDVNRIWQSNIFGKSLYDIAEEGLSSKIESLPENAKHKLQLTLERMINEGSVGLICILL